MIPQWAVPVTVCFFWLAFLPCFLWYRTSCGKYVLGGLWSLHHLQPATEIEGLHTWPSDSLTLLAKMMGSRTCTCPKLGQSQALWEVEYMDPFSLSVSQVGWIIVGSCQCSFPPISIVGCNRLPTQWSWLQKGTGVGKGEKIKLLAARASGSSSTWGWCTADFFSCTNY